MFDTIVAKEGHGKIFLAFIAFLFFVIVECSFLTLISFVIFVFLIYIYRYKYLDINKFDKNSIYAPISGVVTAIDVDGFKRVIHINVSLFNSHILRSLDNGKADIFIKRGLNIFLSSYKSKKLNEKAILNFKNGSVELISSLFNETIKIDSKAEFIKGQKIGTFLHGEVLVTLNDEFECKTKIGEKVQSGITILGTKE